MTASSISLAMEIIGLTLAVIGIWFPKLEQSIEDFIDSAGEHRKSHAHLIIKLATLLGCSSIYLFFVIYFGFSEGGITERLSAVFSEASLFEAIVVALSLIFAAFSILIVIWVFGIFLIGPSTIAGIEIIVASLRILNAVGNQNAIAGVGLIIAISGLFIEVLI